MGLSRILYVDAGGTISQSLNSAGTLDVTEESLNYLNQVRGLEDIAIIEYLPTSFRIDSTNMTTENRRKLAQLIYENYDDFDGFVIGHGTDTMVDSAAALNYMLGNLGKPVVFTGSQIPILNPGNDAKNNVYNAVKTATLDLGEVVIVFGNYVLRGNRTIKESEFDLNAFMSYRISPIGTIGLELRLNGEKFPRTDSDLDLFLDFDTKVVYFDQNSGSELNLLEQLVRDEDVHGIVIGGYWAGNIQNRYIENIKLATSKGKPIVGITVCLKGEADSSLYKAGKDALDAGLISCL